MREVEEEEEEEEPTWFSRWEDDLPRPDELMPLSQSLITPRLALAFHLPNPNPNPNPSSSPPPPPPPPPDDEPARTLKRPRLVWTPQLHKRFVDAVAHLGIKNAVPKTIMQLMSVDGLTRENVASHLQKYRLYLKRMQGLSSSNGAQSDAAAAENLFSNSFLCRDGSGQESYMQFLSGNLFQRNQQMGSGLMQSYYNQRQMGESLIGLNRIGVLANPAAGVSVGNCYGDEMDCGSGGGGRRILTLFPTRSGD